MDIIVPEIFANPAKKKNWPQVQIDESPFKTLWPISLLTSEKRWLFTAEEAQYLGWQLIKAGLQVEIQLEGELHDSRPSI